MGEDPDFTVDQLEDLATEEQLAKLQEMSKFGWKPSHLWEREPGEIAIWCITHGLGREADTLLHCYVLPNGTMRRYDPRKDHG